MGRSTGQTERPKHMPQGFESYPKSKGKPLKSSKQTPDI